MPYPVHTVKWCCFLLVSLRNDYTIPNYYYILIGVKISFWSSGFSLERSREYSVIVIFNVIAGLSIESLNITVRDPSDEFRNSTTVEMPVGGKSYTMRIVFDSVRLTDAGQFLCLGAITDTNSVTATFNFHFDNLGERQSTRTSYLKHLYCKHSITVNTMNISLIHYYNLFLLQLFLYRLQ